jgi:hypothetical protein
METVATPGVPGGVVAWSSVLETTTTLVALLPPIVTVAPLRKSAPLMVMRVPPLTAPALGEMLSTVGIGTSVTY